MENPGWPRESKQPKLIDLFPIPEIDEPTEEAMEFIIEHKKHGRKIYAAYLMIKPPELRIENRTLVDPLFTIPRDEDCNLPYFLVAIEMGEKIWNKILSGPMSEDGIIITHYATIPSYGNSDFSNKNVNNICLLTLRMEGNRCYACIITSSVVMIRDWTPQQNGCALTSSGSLYSLFGSRSTPRATALSMVGRALHNLDSA